MVIRNVGIIGGRTGPHGTNSPSNVVRARDTVCTYGMRIIYPGYGGPAHMNAGICRSNGGSHVYGGYNRAFWR